MKDDHKKFLNNLTEWLEVDSPATAAQHLKTEYPSLTIEECRVIVDHWWAAKPRLLNEGDLYSGC